MTKQTGITSTTNNSNSLTKFQKLALKCAQQSQIKGGSDIIVVEEVIIG